MIQIEFGKIWMEQCDAAETIRDRFGLEKAISYLVGEKFLDFLEASDRHIGLAQEIASFSARVRDMFEPQEISMFLDSLLEGASASKDEEWCFDDFEDAEIDAKDVVREAERITLIGRAKDILLPFA